MDGRNKINGKLTRREFIAGTAALAAAGMAGGKLRAEGSRFHAIPTSPLPTRRFGKTGAKVPLLTFGSGSRWVQYDTDTALKVMNEAIDSGVFYLDSAHGYGNGKSEERIGMLMPARRKEVLIQTKIMSRGPDQFRKDLELSLKRLNVDYVDSLLMHSMQHEDDLEAVEKKGGTLEQLYRAKEEGLARWVGASSHTNSLVLATLLGRHELDVVQMALNVATNNARDMGFEENALPMAVERDMGIIAMKVMGQDQIVGKYDKFDYATCLRYCLSLPISSATVGMPQPEHLPQNIEVVRNFKPYSDSEREKIKADAAGEIKTSFAEFMAGHRDTA